MIKTSNKRLHSVLDSIDSFASTVTDEVAHSLEPQSSSSPSSLELSNYINLFYEDTIRRVSYISLSIASIVGAEKPAQNPFDDPTYSLSIDLSADNLSVGDAAKAIVELISQAVKDESEFGEKWAEIVEQVDGTCECPSIEKFSNIKNDWEELAKVLSKYFGVKSSANSLISYLSKGMVEEITEIYEDTINLMKSLSSCRKCLIGNVGRSRNFKNANDESAVKRLENIFKNDLILREKLRERCDKGVERRILKETKRNIEAMKEGVENFDRNIEGINKGEI